MLGSLWGDFSPRGLLLIDALKAATQNCCNFFVSEYERLPRLHSFLREHQPVERISMHEVTLAFIYINNGLLTSIFFLPVHCENGSEGNNLPLGRIKSEL